MLGRCVSIPDLVGIFQHRLMDTAAVAEYLTVLTMFVVVTRISGTVDDILLRAISIFTTFWASR